jgi:hypothetical protein
MKTVYIICSLLFVSIACTAQEIKGYLITEAEFNAITYNGATIADIEATDGVEFALRKLFGDYTTKKESDVFDSITFQYHFNQMSYDYEYDRVISITIKDNTWPVVVQGNTFRVGDSIDDLQQKFGAGFKTYTSKYTTGRIFTGFSFETNDYNDLFIEFDPDTERITRIKYYLIP